MSHQNLLSDVSDILHDAGDHLRGRAAIADQGHPLASVVIFRVPPRSMKNVSLELILTGKLRSSGFCDAANGRDKDGCLLGVSSLRLLVNKMDFPLVLLLIPGGTFTRSVEDHMGSQVKFVHCRFHICAHMLSISRE